MDSPSTMADSGRIEEVDLVSAPSDLPSDLPPQPGIYLDAKFSSFDQFRDRLEEWMVKNFHPFRVASSEVIRDHEDLRKTFKYRYIVYHCAHYGNPRKRGKGTRPNQNYLPCGCKANLRLNYSNADRCLKITTLKEEHENHEMSEENFKKCWIKLKMDCKEVEKEEEKKEGKKEEEGKKKGEEKVEEKKEEKKKEEKEKKKKEKKKTVVEEEPPEKMKKEEKKEEEKKEEEKREEKKEEEKKEEEKKEVKRKEEEEIPAPPPLFIDPLRILAVEVFHSKGRPRK